MKVMNLAEYRYRRELAVLESVRRRVLRGEMKAIAICTKAIDDTEQISVLGDYRARPHLGAAVAMEMFIRLNQMAQIEGAL